MNLEPWSSAWMYFFTWLWWSHTLSVVLRIWRVCSHQHTLKSTFEWFEFCFWEVNGFGTICSMVLLWKNGLLPMSCMASELPSLLGSERLWTHMIWYCDFHCQHHLSHLPNCHEFSWVYIRGRCFYHLTDFWFTNGILVHKSQVMHMQTIWLDHVDHLTGRHSPTLQRC